MRRFSIFILYSFYILCMSLFLSSAGCAGSLINNYGEIIPDGNITTMFEKYQINPHFNYYISGSDVYPNAILGVDKTYTLESDLWKKVDMTHAKFRELVTSMQDRVRALSIKLTLHGFVMLDDKGKQIGVWYSILSVRTSVKMKDSRTVIIDTPDIDTYLKYEN